MGVSHRRCTSRAWGVQPAAARLPEMGRDAAETRSGAAGGCVATAAARLAAVDPASPLGAAYILDRDSGHGRESDGAGRRPPAT